MATETCSLPSSSIHSIGKWQRKNGDKREERKVERKNGEEEER